MLRGTCRRRVARMTCSSACSPKRGNRPPAGTKPGDASVIYRSGTITIQGSNSTGIFAGVQASGSAEITTLPGTTIIVSGNNPGDPLDPAIAADLYGTAADGRKIMVDAASTIMMHGSRAPDSSLTNDPIGIRALSRSRRFRANLRELHRPRHYDRGRAGLRHPCSCPQRRRSRHQQRRHHDSFVGADHDKRR